MKNLYFSFQTAFSHKKPKHKTIHSLTPSQEFKSLLPKKVLIKYALSGPFFLKLCYFMLVICYRRDFNWRRYITVKPWV